jgi:hypothetical protein
VVFVVVVDFVFGVDFVVGAVVLVADDRVVRRLAARPRLR